LKHRSISLREGDLDDALAYCTQAHQLHRDMDDRLGQARVLTGMGRVLQAMGNQAGARGAWQDALATFVELDSPEAAAVQACLDEEPSAPTSRS
jgi:tetratricopeptide (TPR) repeat protein